MGRGQEDRIRLDWQLGHLEIFQPRANTTKKNTDHHAKIANVTVNPIR
jgi:hypothetical protein